jgi:ferritin-like metal-binding protein YciE
MEVAMAGLASAQDVLAHELTSIHSAERQISRALPRLMRKISSDQLRQMLDKRLSQGASLIDEIDDVLDELEASKPRPKNLGAEGLIADATDLLEDPLDDSLIDPLVLAFVQKLEHYCIAAWGTAAALGRLLDQDEAVNLMERVLQEGRRFDEELTALAESEINRTMLQRSDEKERTGKGDEDKGKRARRKAGARRSGGRKQGKSR